MHTDAVARGPEVEISIPMLGPTEVETSIPMLGPPPEETEHFIYSSDTRSNRLSVGARSAEGCLGMPQDASGCLGMPKDASECLGVPKDASGCLRMPRNASGCIRVPQLTTVVGPVIRVTRKRSI